MFIYFSGCWPMFFWQEKKNIKVLVLKGACFITKKYQSYVRSFFSESLLSSLIKSVGEILPLIHVILALSLRRLQPFLYSPEDKSITYASISESHPWTSPAQVCHDVQLVCKTSNKEDAAPLSQTCCRGFSPSVNVGWLFIPQVQELST